MTNRLREQVAEFMVRFRQPIRGKPETPPLDRLKLRARLIAEETIETVEAMCAPVKAGTPLAPDDIVYYLQANHDPGAPVTLFSAAQALLMGAIADTVPRVLTLEQMVKVADGMADLDYVTEGARLEWGVDGTPIAELVHLANMTKSPAVDDHGKAQKPAGFVPPDEAIGDELRRQGFIVTPVDIPRALGDDGMMGYVPRR